MVALLLQECVEEKITIMKDRLMLDILRKHHCFRKLSSEWVDLAYDKGLITIEEFK